jgi:hemoglobin
MQIQEHISGSTNASPQTTLYKHVGGEAVVQAIVTRFYDLMDLEPQFAILRGVQDPLHTRLMESFFGTADWMRNTDG